MTYYDFVHKKVGKKMLDESEDAKSGSTNESELKAGNGISVKLSKNNYNVHINFPDKATGGRSYGWTAGQIGDWSDAMYLDNLADVIAGDESNLEEFYKVIVQMLGSCNSSEIDSLSKPAQRVAANFLAIYTAEQYRSMVPNDPHRNWDDALLEVTLLGAFHGGQSELKKYYLGDFSADSKKQGSGVYAKSKPGPTAEEAEDKRAELRDYWQFSANPDSKQSGINITRYDFEKMGEAITEYESKVARNKTLGKIQKIVGGDSDNVIKSISKFYSTGRAEVSHTDGLAELIASFLTDVYNDADKISKWIENTEQ